VWTWPNWIMVETAFNLELEWMCLQETKQLEALSILYLSVNIIWKAGVILPAVDYLFSSQWLPPKSRDIWQNPGLEFLFSSVKNLRFKCYVDWKATPFGVKHAKVGGKSTKRNSNYNKYSSI
jgi:hypothetical protein